MASEDGLGFAGHDVADKGRRMGRSRPSSPVFSKAAPSRLHAPNLLGIKEPLLKRPFDACLSGLGLLFSLPLWALIALAIKLEDGGPVFYHQERWGQGRRQIRVRKFRTMLPHSNPKGVSVQASERDPRITRVGRFLRATALDELPQLLNIWKGEMSFVGPRALPINERQAQEDRQEVLDEQIPAFDARLRVKPGLTGIAQIYAMRDIPRWQKFRYDLFYIKKQTVWLDLKLIALSFWITFRGKWEHRGRKFRRRRKLPKGAIVPGGKGAGAGSLGGHAASGPGDRARLVHRSAEGGRQRGGKPRRP